MSRYCVAGTSTSWQRRTPQKHLSTIITAVHEVAHQAIEKRPGKENYEKENLTCDIHFSSGTERKWID